MNEIARTYGKRIRERRKTLGMSQVTLAEMVGVDQTAVSQWERGVACPSRRNEAAILDALNAHGIGMFELPKQAVA